MRPSLRRAGWGLVGLLVLLSGLSACAVSQIGAGAGLAVALVLAVGLVLGGTQTGCAVVRPCLSVAPAPCLSPLPEEPKPGPDSGAPAPLPPDDLRICLSILPPDDEPGPGAQAPDEVGAKREALAELEDRLPGDVLERLGLDAKKPQG